MQVSRSVSHCLLKCSKNLHLHFQHLLWMGSDPLGTLLFSDWFGSTGAAVGVGARLCFLRRASTTASSESNNLRGMFFTRRSLFSVCHLRARPLFVRAETWGTKTRACSAINRRIKTPWLEQEQEQEPMNWIEITFMKRDGRRWSGALVAQFP